MSEILQEPTLRQKVHFAGGRSAVIKAKITNFAVPLWEITLENGKSITEARYRFDLVPNFNPPKNVQIQQSEHTISSDDDNDLSLLYDCVMSQKSETEIISLTHDSPAEVIQQIINISSEKKIKQKAICSCYTGKFVFVCS